MKYDELQAVAAGMATMEVDNLLRSLLRDDRFIGVVAWLDRNRELFVRSGSKQDLASDHGKLAHCQGSVHAVNLLIAQLANLLNPAPQTGEQPPPNL